jgi:hypothetical protein
MVNSLTIVFLFTETQTVLRSNIQTMDVVSSHGRCLGARRAT